MKIISWNVNGLRACLQKGFLEFLTQTNPDIVCLQEVRAEESQLIPVLESENNYSKTFYPASKKGYSGVATWLNQQTVAQANLVQSKGMEHSPSDHEGRVIYSVIGDLHLYNIYFPNGSRDHSRVEFKLDFYRHLETRLKQHLSDNHKVIVTGDFNTAPEAIDLANPQANEKTTGFLPIEREILARYFEMGYVDIFRKNNPDSKGHYTWWSNRPGVREKNIGWRIDYFVISPNLVDEIVDVQILSDVLGSDHCPILLELRD
jgi:exodeoxyribonuclease III